MPYKYVEPAVIMQIGNVTIYHTYKENSQMYYHFTEFKEDCDEDVNNTWFDIRETAAWKRVKERMRATDQDDGSDDVAIRWALFEGIMCGEIGKLNV